MIKKILPYVLIGISLVLLMVLMTTITTLRENNQGILKTETIIEAVISILMMTIGIAILLKRN